MPDNLQKVVDNLLSNAIKFSPDGSQVQLKLQINGDDLALAICDEGPGIPEHEKELVFEPFYRGTSTRSERVEGGGVGLAISRDFVTAHGGADYSSRRSRRLPGGLPAIAPAAPGGRSPGSCLISEMGSAPWKTRHELGTG